MIDLLREYISRKERVPNDKYLQILGSDAKLKSFASFWNSNGDSLMTAVTVLLHDYVSEQTFTKEEFVAYRRGISELGVFFSDCAKIIHERQEKKDQQDLREG